MVISRSLRLIAGVSLGLLAACSQPDGPVEIHDPYEPANRRVHAFNKGLDRAVVRPASQVYGTVLPGPARTGVSNVAATVAGPSHVVNSLLQGRPDDAAHNAVRFIVNATLGIGGLFDTATAIGLTERDTDFGETLYVWGVAEGAYLETPFFGPSTQRRTAGRVVDFFTNPLTWNMSEEATTGYVGVRVGGGLDGRYRLDDTISSVLYESADSYAQTRSIYLQNRRFELQGETAEGIELDIYEDLYADIPE